jgi:hypothetical protein
MNESIVLVSELTNSLFPRVESTKRIIKPPMSKLSGIL